MDLKDLFGNDNGKQASSLPEGDDIQFYGTTAAMDSLLQGTSLGDAHNSVMMGMTDIGRAANALPLPVKAGTRVRFVADLGSVLTYDNIPEEGVEGTVVKVKSAAGKVTSYEGSVFVHWDDGKFRSIQAEHLRRASHNKRTARNFAFRVSALTNLSDIFRLGTSSSGDELVHKATKDLWSFRQDNGGGYVIERLFQEDGVPLKV